MSSETFVLLNSILTMGVPILWCLYELWSLGRARSGRDDRRAPEPPAPKPLPDCLIPKPIVRQRVLEDA
ncbi:hypothetical protein ACE7GA_12870 [Roseomonas sp. CCTCC AB2023176]|uniref:hypothetical protein n=1 Tax=Roseomonas sp. CCTCC AB2023176 TaxID=3342640 RepID=UPI0035E15B3C